MWLPYQPHSSRCFFSQTLYLCVYTTSISNQVHCCHYYVKKVLSVRSSKKKNIKDIILLSLVLSLTLFLSLCRSKFLTYTICLLSKELVWKFLARQVYWQQIPSIFDCLRKSLLPLHFLKSFKKIFIHWF